jgi:pilus assembly protein Flp/PilA
LRINGASKFTLLNRVIRWASDLLNWSTNAAAGAKTMFKFVKKFVANESGATAIEYALIASLIAVAIITALTALGTRLSTTFGEVSGNLK